MAKLHQGILGAFTGKVGTVVGYVWRDRQVVRAYRKEINYPDTESQRLEREWFVSMVRFAATARPALLLGLRERAARDQMTEGNAFVKMNKRCFARTYAPVAACGGATPSSLEGEFGIDYEKIRIAEGSAAPVRFAAAEIGDSGILRVDFEKNSGMCRAKGSDRVYIYIYNTETREGLLSAPAERRGGRLQMQLPDGWNELNTRMWGFTVDRECRASSSAHIAWSALEEEPRMEEEMIDCGMGNEEKKGDLLMGGKNFSCRNTMIFSPTTYKKI